MSSLTIGAAVPQLTISRFLHLHYTSPTQSFLSDIPTLCSNFAFYNTLNHLHSVPAWKLVPQVPLSPALADVLLSYFRQPDLH